MRLFARFIATVVLGMGASCLITAPVQAETVKPIAFPQDHSEFKPDPQTRYGRLANGMTYILRHNVTPPGMTGVYLRIAAGSMMETPQQRGLAHFVEHMAFEGSSHVPNGELQKILQRHGFAFGADINANTYTTDTIYKLIAPKNDDDSLNTTLFLLREVAEGLTISQGDVDRERGVILSELRTRDTPQLRAVLKLRQVEAPGLLAADRLNIGGSPDIIAAAKATDLRRFYDTWYRPELATLIIVGDFDVDAMEAKVRTEFGGWQARAPAPAEPDWGQYVPGGERTLDVVDAGLTDTMMVNWIAPGDARSDTSARETDNWQDRFLAYFFNKRLQARALSSDTALIGASLGTSSDIHGIREIRLMIAPRPGKAEAAFQEAMGMLESFRAAGPTQTEIDQLRTGIPSLEHQVEIQWQTETSAARIDNFIGALRADAVVKDPAGASATLETAQSHLMSPTDMQARLKSWFDGDGPVLVHIAPTPSDFDAKHMLADYDGIKAQSAAAYNDTERKPWPYPVGTVPVEPSAHTTDADFGFSRYVWPNGVVLNFKHTDFTASQILVNVDFPGGEAMFGPHPAVPPALAQDTLVRDGGLGKIDYPDMQKTLSRFYWSVGYGLEPSVTRLRGEARLGGLPIELQVLLAYATDPALNINAFDRMRATAPQLLKVIDASPTGALAEANAHIFFNDDPRFGFAALEHLDTVDYPAVQAMIRQSLSTGPITINMVGDVPEANAVKAIGLTFATLPERPAAPQLPAGADQVDLTIHDHDVTLHHQGPMNQSLDELHWTTTDCHDIRTIRGLDVVAAVVRNRLFDSLREKDGADYAPSASADCSYVYKGVGAFTISSAVKAGDDAVFRKAVKTILDDLRDHPPTDDEMVRATKPILASLDNETTNNAYWRDLLNSLDALPGYRANALSRRADYQSITAADVSRLVRTWFREDNLVHVRVLPEPAVAQDAPPLPPVTAAPTASPAPIPVTH
jgi:zinc protease